MFVTIVRPALKLSTISRIYQNDLVAVALVCVVMIGLALNDRCRRGRSRRKR